MILDCVSVPRHQRRGPNGCEECLAALVDAVRSQPTPLAAIEHFGAAAQQAMDETRRRQRWWIRKDPAETARAYRFALAAREMAAVEAFRLHSPRERGFASQKAYDNFKDTVLGLGHAPTLNYHETMALLAGYRTPHLIGPDGAAIELLEQHRDKMWPTVPEDIQRAVLNHTRMDDYNGWGRVDARQIARIRDWIREHGQLPHPVLTYRQESLAYSHDRTWWDRVQALVPGDTISWDDRPVSTSLDPGFTRQADPGWGPDEEWTPTTRYIHFIITATKGFYVGSATSMPFNEHELILEPGQAYRVTEFRQHSTLGMNGKRYGGGSRLYIVLEEVPGT